MQYEYALEPGLLSTWDNYRYLTEKFGVEHGRLISRYPKKWKKMVYDSLTRCGELERKRIEVALTRIDDRLLVRAGAHHDPTLAWLDNAETEHAVRPFRAVISGSNPRSRSFVLDGHTLDETAPLWQSPGSLRVVRQAADMADAVRPLLECCSEVVFVDPHFGPENLRHRRPFEAFMAILGIVNGYRKLVRIEYHTSDKAAVAFFQAECKKHLPQLLPAGLPVRLVRWRQSDLHNRLILTDVGGLLIGQGLDEGTDPPNDDFARLSEAVWQRHWADYVVSPVFTLVDNLSIVGTKT